MKKKLISLLLVAGLCIGTYFAAQALPTPKENPAAAFPEKDTLHLWYADDSMTDYLTNVAAAYYEKTGIHVIPTLRTGLEYLEEIYTASTHPGEETLQMPDMYIISNDSLEKAYLSGLAVSLKDKGEVLSQKNFPKTALDAVSYQGKYVGYPLYYETSAFLYNKTYLEEAGKEPPKTVDDILTFADEYDAPEQVEAVFRWDVSDIFYNYYFIGNYMIVGGEAGDDSSQIDIDNDKTEECLQIYQNLNQFFSIDTKEVTYDSVLQDFMEGKVVMTVATSDALAKLENEKNEGGFPYEYGLAKMPNLTAQLKGRSLSVTNAIAVNGFSEKNEAAEAFAAFLETEYAQTLYDAAGKLPAAYGDCYTDEKRNAFLEEYQSSISMPKLLGTSNFWVQLEICFSRIWDGAEVGQLLGELAEQIGRQLV